MRQTSILSHLKHCCKSKYSILKNHVLRLMSPLVDKACLRLGVHDFLRLV